MHFALDSYWLMTTILQLEAMMSHALKYDILGRPLHIGLPC